MRIALALALVMLTLAPAGAGARSRPRADLVVSDGAVKSSDGRLAGSFVVKNKGSKAAGASTAALTTKIGKKTKTIKRFRIKVLRSGKKATTTVAAAIPAGLPAGSLKLKVCADSGGAVSEKSESNNCANVGTLKLTTTPPPPDDSPPPQVPTAPVTYETDTPLQLTDAQSPYWVNAPASYDGSHQTPTKLLVWMHGCGGDSGGDAYTISPQGRDWISVSVGGRDNDCWDVNNDTPKVLAALNDVEKHFNIDRHRVVIGGYSSGGDLAYRTAFYNAKTFAGLLAENTSPFRDTGSPQGQSIAAAAWKFNVVHLAHLQDDTYPIEGVRQELQALSDAGFPVTKIERDGGHGDATSDPDLINLLLPHIDDGWTSP